MRNIMKEAHKMAKEITTKYKGVDYKVQLGLCLSYLASKEEEVMEYKTSKGTEVKVELEGRLIKNLSVNNIEVVRNNKSSNIVYVNTFDNTITLNDRSAYMKLGGKSIIRIEASKELVEAFKKADKEEREAREKRLQEKFIWKATINTDYTFEKHMNDINA